MLKHFFILFIILYAHLLMTGCDTKHASILSDNARILAFGDSLTYGTGAQKGEDYPSVLASLTGLEIINAGIPGEVSSDGLKRLPNLLDKHQPDLLILVHGGNDILRKLSRSELKKNLLAMINEAKNRNIHVVSLGVPEPGIFLKSAEPYQQLNQETELLIDLKLLPEIIGDTSLKADLAHPNARGYQKMAEGLFDFLQEHHFID